MVNRLASIHRANSETVHRKSRSYCGKSNAFTMKGGIFDLDGTLLDSMSMWKHLGTSYLLQRGITPIDDVNQKLEALSLAQAAEYYQREYKIKDSVELILRELDQLLEYYYFEEAQLKPGVRNMLDDMKERGVKLCLATATDEYLVCPALERTGILSYFSDILTCAKVGFGKDQPHIYEAALLSLGTKKADTLIFEDALYAVKTAKKAGFLVAGIHDELEEKHWGEMQNLIDFSIHDWESFSFEQLHTLFDKADLPR